MTSLKIDLFVEIHNGLKCGVLKALSAQGMGHLHQTPMAEGTLQMTGQKEFQSSDEKQNWVVMTSE